MMLEELNFKELAVGLFDKELQYHALKHFKIVDDSYMERLRNSKICTRDQIRDRLKWPGSKFNPLFVSNPEELAKVLFRRLKKKNILVEWKNNRCELEMVFEREEFPGGIGLDNLLHQDELSGPEKEKIREQETNTISLKTVIKIPPPTWQIHLILVRDMEGIRVLTIFPGKYAPVFPDQEIQSGEEFLISESFWGNHVLIFEE